MASPPPPWHYRPMVNERRYQHHWIFCVAALMAGFAWGWPAIEALIFGTPFRDLSVPLVWLVPFAVFMTAALSAMGLKLPAHFYWALLGVQLAAVVTMTLIVPWAGMSEFLIIIAWQAAMTTTTTRALGWVAFQTAVMMVVLAEHFSLEIGRAHV